MKPVKLKQNDWMLWLPNLQRCISVLVGCHRSGWLIAMGFALWAGPVGTVWAEADRTTLFFPLPADASVESATQGEFADARFGSPSVPGWAAYIRLWESHHADPKNQSIRRFLGLPLDRSVKPATRRGRSAPGWLRWRGGSYQQIETPHFTIYSRASADTNQDLAEDLERCYWIWTQMFYPLWESSAQVTTTLSKMGDNQSITEFLEGKPPRISNRRRLQVVVFGDVEEYRTTIGVPGIERSTGYYSDQRRTTFLYDAPESEPASRRHELVHQLFREATRSGLGRTTPGEKSGFWLIEGIAGYFESLHIGSTQATVGGWDSPRLQFARYRILGGADRMPLRELHSEERVAAQQRSDVARWYSHSIAYMHLLLDDGNSKWRQWVYGQLARLYKIRIELTVEKPSASQIESSLLEFLSIDDEHLAANPTTRPIRQLCLAGCDVTDAGLESIGTLAKPVWLDLARQPVSSGAIMQLAPDPSTIEQLTLELTPVDSLLLDWLAAAPRIRELDLSFTGLGDEAIQAIRGADQLSILWMTGTQVTDQAIGPIGAMARRESVDLQRTKVTSQGLAKLRRVRPELEINPLEILER